MKKPEIYIEPTSPAAKLGRFLSRAVRFATGGMPLELYTGLMLGGAVMAFGFGMPFAGIAIGGIVGMYGAVALRRLAQWAVCPEPLPVSA